MIKATFTGIDGRPVYLFGLTEMNLNKLRQGKPIAFDLESIGGTGHVTIMYGSTEAEIAHELAEFIGPNTKVSGLQP